MLRTRAVEVSLWEAVLPDEVLRLTVELARVDALLDDPVFFAPFVPFFDPRLGRPSTPIEVYLRLMFLKFRNRLGYETLCREVSDSITWRRFCRIPLDGNLPHPTTLMKLTTRCGPAAVDGCNQALLAKAAEAKLLRTTRLRADTTVVPADVAYPTDSGLLAKAVRRIAIVFVIFPTFASLIASGILSDHGGDAFFAFNFSGPVIPVGAGPVNPGVPVF
jgi:IS5 family transposase